MDAPPAMTIPFKNRRRCNAADSESAMSVLPLFSGPRKAGGLTDFLSQAGEPTASTRSNPDRPSSAADDIAYGDDAAGGRTAVARRLDGEDGGDDELIWPPRSGSQTNLPTRSVAPRRQGWVRRGPGRARPLRCRLPRASRAGVRRLAWYRPSVPRPSGSRLPRAEAWLRQPSAWPWRTQMQSRWYPRCRRGQPCGRGWRRSLQIGYFGMRYFGIERLVQRTPPA